MLWLGVLLLALGATILTLVVWPASPPQNSGSASLATRLLQFLTLDGQLVKLFPVFGITLAFGDIAYNLSLSATPNLQTEDSIVLLAAVTLVGYGFVPEKFAKERDFVFVFCIIVNALLVAPLLMVRVFYSDFGKSVDAYSWVALAPETSFILSLLGVSNTVHAVSGSTAPGITFIPQNLGLEATVVITTACSGIYSFGIFASAFIAYVLTEYDRTGPRVWALLGLGLATSYVANVLRMVAIVLVGYYTDTAETDLQNLLIAHSYAGWLIFLVWVALFWGIVFRFMPKTRSDTRPLSPKSPRSETRCHECTEILTPAVPAKRCRCGAYYHRQCLVSRAFCTICGRPA